MAALTKQKLERAHKQFYKIEGRASFYDLAREIVGNYPLQSAIILLATWNKSRFRYITGEKNLNELEKAISYCAPRFKKLRREKLLNANFDKIQKPIEEIYSRLSVIKGVEYTGTSKVMHLFNPELFVMWDTAIRKRYKCPQRPRAEDYLCFLKKMQEKSKTVNWKKSSPTLAKVLDEYNYVTISKVIK